MGTASEAHSPGKERVVLFEAMAVHKHLAGMAVEAIEEYLDAAALCLDTTKPDGGCLGYAATLLLFCVIDALGSYVKHDRVMIDTRSCKIGKESFRVFNHRCFGLNLTSKQITCLAGSYRNLLAHNAIIDLDAFLISEKEVPAAILFKPHNAVGGINVRLFHKLVSGAWSRFPRERIGEWEKQYRNFRKSRV